jgi:hypothetical protein
VTQTVDGVLATPPVRTQAFIDGVHADSASGETFGCVSPGTGG